MYDVTTRFLRALRVGGTVDVSCTAWAVGNTSEPSPSPAEPSQSTPPKVGVRRTMTLETTADQWDALSAYGIELRPFRGVRYADGTVERVPLGASASTPPSKPTAPTAKSH